MLRSTAFQGTARMTAGLVAAVVLATPALAAGSTQAQRQPRCIDRQVIEEVLKQRFAEKQAGIGLAEDGRLLEVFSSPDGRTWTLIATSAAGLSCVITSGRTWVQPAPEVPGVDS